MRLHLFVAAISSMIALPALGQVPAQTIPDFSGLWPLGSSECRVGISGFGSRSGAP